MGCGKDFDEEFYEMAKSFFDELSNGSSNDKISMDRSRVLFEKMTKRTHILRSHAIWQNKDGRWCTKVKLPDGKTKMIARKDRTQVEDLIIEYYEKCEDNPTIKELYDIWIEKKLSREDITNTTKSRYDRQYTQCMQEFGNKRIKCLTPYEVEEFLLDTVYEKKLTVKGFSNLRTIIKGLFRMCKKKGYIDWSIDTVLSELDISRKAFKRIRHTDNELVFDDNEIKTLQNAMDEFGLDALNLAIMLLFNTGLRPGEAVALKRKDVSLNYVNVNKTEVILHTDEGTIFKVEDRTKTDAGCRCVIVPDTSETVMKKILRQNPFADPEEYIFQKNGKRITSEQLRGRLRYLCKKTNIVLKSPNKIRKTYASILIDNGVPDSIITQQMGHTNIKTTELYYHKNRFDMKQIATEINRAFCS